MLKFFSLLFCFFTSLSWAANEDVVNVYAWAAVIPNAMIQKFEKETGIKVNFSTYDSNEMMYAKLKASKKSGYDVVEPSSYYVDRMRHQNMLEKIDKTKLTHFKNLNPDLLNPTYDPKNNYSIPYMWGVTGIFLNKDYWKSGQIKKWSDLWDKKYVNQLLLLDDPREVFGVALRALGYSANDANPEHIKEAYLKLKTWLPNTKIFSSAVLSFLIDEDVTVGMVWSGDLFKASQENKQLEFVYPKDGFIIWIDSFVIPKNAPHKENAYRFLDFMLRADVAKTAALETSFPIANLAAQKLLPPEIRNNPTIYPSHEILKHGEFQVDLQENILNLYEKYWERLKMGG